MTEICPYIQFYSTCTWEYLSEVFSYRLKGSELGFTDDLVFRIVQFYKGRPSDCEVYAFSDNVRESIRGADIDLFIQDTETGRYQYFMLQAKVMDHNGRYKDIRKWSYNAQFNRLIRAAHKEGAFPLYLLYNGLTGRSTVGNTHWGLSIVEAARVRTLRHNQRKLNKAPYITFDDLHPLNMQPFHLLFCDIDSNNYNLPPTIDGRNVYTGFPYVIKKYDTREEQVDDSKSPVAIDEGLAIIGNRNLAPVRIVIKSYEVFRI